MPNTEQFIPPSRLARLVSRIIYCGLLLPLEKLVGRWWDGAEPSTLRGRLAFWVLCESWYHFERAAGRL